MILEFNPPVSLGDAEIDELRSLDQAGYSLDNDIINEYHTQTVTNLLKENSNSINMADITS